MENMEKTFKSASTFIILFLIAVAIAAYSFIQYQRAQTEIKMLKQNPQAMAADEINQLVAKVGNLVALPTETPTVATVTDITKLKDQPFFVKAANGDKVLIYTQAKKAYLYRPSINKVIDVATILLGQTTPMVKVAIYNGTFSPDQLSAVQATIKNKVTNVQITTTENAKRTNYDKTYIVDLTGSKATEASQLATLLNGTVTTLPAGEVKPTGADLLVIVGPKQ